MGFAMTIQSTGKVALAAALALGLAACGVGGEPAPDTSAAAPEAETAAPETDMAAAETEAPAITGETLLDNGMTVAALIELRQGQYEQLGDTFRSINQQFRSGDPDLAVVQASVATLPGLVDGMETWFPAGTGPEAGVETEALPSIWETPDDFAQKVAEHQAAIAALAETAEGGDLDAIQAAVRATGATCGACHDDYRLDE